MNKPRFCLVMFFAALVAGGRCPLASAAGGHFEFSFHYGSWSVNILKSTIEGMLSDSVQSEFRDKFLADIQKDYPNFQEKSYSQKVGFDSGDSNFGFEARWYPAGETGSFSLGLAVEQTAMRFTLQEISANLELQDTKTLETASFNGLVNGELKMKPLAFLLNFRWDIFPSWRIRPFITFGLGASLASAIDNLTLTYSYAGDLTVPGQAAEHYQDSAAKTGQDLKDEMETNGDAFPLSFVPFLQLNFGLKGAITKNIYLMVDTGVLDGIILRGAVAVRF